LKRFFSSYLVVIIATFLLLLVLYLIYPVYFLPKNNTENTFYKKNDSTIRVLLNFHASDYFIYKGTPIGFQYDLLKEFEKTSGKKIDITVCSSFDSIYKELFKNNYDIIALDFRRWGLVSPFLEFSLPHSFSKPVLISRKDLTLNKDTLKNVHVPNDYHHFLYIKELKQQKFNLVYQKEYSSEELFDLLQDKEIDYLVCDYNLAVTLLPFYSTLKMLDKVGPEYQRSWVLNKKNTELNHQINDWLYNFMKTRRYTSIINKYFSSRSSVITGTFTKSKRHTISPYDPIIKKYATQYNLDWRFIAAIMYQESKFQAGLLGLGGSYGLMQMMPATMSSFGIDENSGEEEQIAAGVKYVYRIAKSFDNITDMKEKFHFIAASYNAGRGHILDAQRLCEKYQENSTQWTCVSKYLILKSKKEYANDPVVKSGFFPGKQAVKYAAEVVERFEAYLLMYP
jgi:membrane-bound lytic murein transglycosylase F